MAEFNMMICTGLTWSQSAATSSNLRQLDPDTLIAGTAGEEALTATAATPEAGVAACRAYYDSSTFGLPFCFQTIKTLPADAAATAVAYLANTYGQMLPEGVTDPTTVPITAAGTVYTPDAQSFKGAQTIASGMAVVASVMALLQ